MVGGYMVRRWCPSLASIRDGRPHGMPAFRDKMTIEQIWQLAGYVQTIGAYSAEGRRARSQ
jgi:mono/diheme cytochrome c family protein